MLQRYLLPWLCLSSGLAYGSANWLSADWNPLLRSRPWLWYLIGVVMFALGCLLPREEIRELGRRWPTVLGGTAVQYLSMPMLAYGLGRLFQLDEAAMFGVVIVGCVPGAMASNVLTLAARGNVTYSVCLTTSATLLSPLLVPLALYLAFGALDYEFPAGQTAGQLAFFVVLPVGAGHLMARLRGGGSQRTRWIASTTANLGILWIIAVVVAANRDKLLEVQPRTLMALMAINLLGYAAGYGGAMLMRLPIPMRRALTLEVGMQNAGLGTTLAMGLFGAVTEAAIPTAIYTFGCMFTGTVLANVWSGISSTVASKDGEPQRETA